MSTEATQDGTPPSDETPFEKGIELLHNIVVDASHALVASSGWVRNTSGASIRADTRRTPRRTSCTVASMKR